MRMNRFINAISTAKAVNISGFCAGFVWTIGPPHSLFDKPISTTFSGSVGGCIACVGADIVSGFMPRSGIPFFVAILTGSAFSHGCVNTIESYKIIQNNSVKKFL